MKLIPFVLIFASAIFLQHDPAQDRSDADSFADIRDCTNACEDSIAVADGGNEGTGGITT